MDYEQLKYTGDYLVFCMELAEINLSFAIIANDWDRIIACRNYYKELAKLSTEIMKEII